MPAADRKEELSANTETEVGRRLRELRASRGFSLRALAERSGFNINTLSLIENGKTSPSVSTLQQLAHSLEIPITAFFESTLAPRRVVYTPNQERPTTQFGSSTMQNLGKDLAGSELQPFIVTLQPGEGHRDPIIVHTGHEFVFGLTGSIEYRIEEKTYPIGPGDALVFESHLPHSWRNSSPQEARFLLILHSPDRHEEPLKRHFIRSLTQKGAFSMKIAVITEDGKTISQHFGRAPYYMVLSVENGQIVEREMREKMGHNQCDHLEEHHHEGEHGHDEDSHGKHVHMAEAIRDCQVLLCGGMGYGAYESIRRLNIQPVVTDQNDIDAAVQDYLNGTLVDHTEKLH
ncbi:uncharacterized conserved protein [Longilinea arvoryzae]|uniref:Uncharacterized conserved protein n=1 Tax=Longilinea arvoryzae TaxID=360412 RepID=A0A0S7BEL3_9CHLR|nr:NifB/NifX family molybdenum-iron cluster-binding protein [Longilinea arvoryzae]GAP12434.1 uncharacterized conserved protein [Longilinea arvoryzae]